MRPNLQYHTQCPQRRTYSALTIAVVRMHPLLLAIELDRAKDKKRVNKDAPGLISICVKNN